MADATLDSIEATLFAALSTLAKLPSPIGNPTGGFSLVDRWVGELPRFTGPVLQAAYRTPFALLAFEAEDPRDSESVETLQRQFQTAGESRWTVLVGVSDPRTAKQVAKGDAGSAVGVYALAGSVIAALNGLRVPSPNTTLSVQVVGTPGANVALDGVAHVLASSTGTTYQFTPAAQSFVLDGSGHATILAPLTYPVGTLGNIGPAATLTWLTTPTNCSATANNLGFSTQGANGLLFDEVIHYAGTRPIPGGMVPGKLFTLGVRFKALRAVEQVGNDDPSVAYAGTTARLHLEDSFSTTIASASAGATLPRATINVFSTTNAPAAGVLRIPTSTGSQLVTYTGTTATSFTGCSGGTGVLSQGAYVTLVGLIDPIVTVKDS